MARKKTKRTKGKYIKILDKASFIVGILALTLGVARKLITNGNKAK